MDNLREKLAHYQADLPDELLREEAIATLEAIFSYLSEEELLHHSRHLAIAYLALTFQPEE